MAEWQEQFDTLIAPAIARSEATKHVVMTQGALQKAGAVCAEVTDLRRILVCADKAGYAAAGDACCDSLVKAGFSVETLILPADPLPKASVDEAAPFMDRLQADLDLFPVSVGSGVINDLVKYAAFQTDHRYVSVATASSMDGYTSAGAPLARDGFKVTIPTRAPIALVADLDVIAAAPAEMTGWGYGDLAGKSPAGGDWLLAELVGAEDRDDLAWPLVQGNLRDWLSTPELLAKGDIEAAASLFIGLTAVGFAMEFHGTSRPASGADHQIAHLWEMEDHAFEGRKVSHGAAVAIGCIITLRLYDWLLAQDLTQIAPAAPDLSNALISLHAAIADARISSRAIIETKAKWSDAATHAARMSRVRGGWTACKDALQARLFRADEMAVMLQKAGAPSQISDIGISPGHLEQTIRAAVYIRSRYTILDFLHEIGLFEEALTHVMHQVRAETAERASA